MSATMFSAVVWKEFRAHLKWAVFVLLLMGGGVIFKLGLLLELPRDGIPTISSLASFVNGLEGVAALGGALAGLLLGVAQALAENRGDKWGFLVHRPVSRSMLFRGKAAAGILLYVFSTGVPVAGALLQLATLEYLPVLFDWRIALPVIANLFCGLVFYFAGFLTGMRSARWYSSRALGIAAALGCLGLQVVAATAFWQAAAISAAGIALVGTAAWGTFIAGGQYGPQPRAGRIATGLSIGIGMAIIGAIAFQVFLTPLRQQIVPLSPDRGYSGYTVTSDGMFVRITREGTRIVEVTDLDGHPVQYNRNSSRNPSGGADVLTARFWARSWSIGSFQSIGWLFTQLRNTSSDDPASWYYAHRQGLVAAYDSRSRQLIGWLGPDGFSTGDALPRSFKGRLKRQVTSGDQHLLLFEDTVYRVDLDDLRVEMIFQSGPAELLLDVAVPYSSSRSPATSGVTDFVAIWTTHRVILQLRNGTKLLEAIQEAGTREFPGLEIHRALAAPGSPTFLWYEGNPAKADRVAELDAAGATVNSWILAPGYRVVEKSWLHMATASALLPPIGHVALDIIDRTQVPRTSLPLSGPARLMSWGVAILSSLVCATGVFLRGRVYAFPPGRLFTWTAITLLLGPLGYLTMLALIEWPARESCPACSRKRVVVRERCEHCGAPFAEPRKDGTEIFEPATASPAT